MQNRGLSSLLEYLRRELPLPGPDLVPDGELLTRFTETKDEAAFELLVRRHGPMVFGVARRLVRNEHTAEDVLQATFLALARQATSLRNKQSIAAWLYRVAVRISLRARQRILVTAPIVASVSDNSNAFEQREVKTAIDSAIDRLPEKLRRAVVLCYVSGHSTEEASRLLDCPKGTILSRLAAAREKLQTELKRKGITVSAVTLSAVLTSELNSASLPVALVAIAMKAAGPTAALTPIVITLAQGAVAMSWIKVAVASVVTLTAGVGLAVGLAGPGRQPPVEKPTSAVKPTVDVPKTEPPEKKDKPWIAELETFQRSVASVVANPADTAIKKVMKERAECAILELGLRVDDFAVGRGLLAVCLDAARRSHDSALEVARDPNQELSIRIGYLKILRFMDHLNDARFKAGTIKEQDMLQTKYARLDAEVQLLKHGGNPEMVR